MPHYLAQQGKPRKKRKRKEERKKKKKEKKKEEKGLLGRVMSNDKGGAAGEMHGRT